MSELFICHGPADRAVAQKILARLSSLDGVYAVTEECEPGCLPEAWEAAEDAAAAILLLSPDSIPAVPTRENWGRVLESASQKTGPALACVVVQRCNHPRLLEAHSHFTEWSGSETLRNLARWACELTTPVSGAPPLSALPEFEGRRDEMARLFAELVDRPGRLALTGPSGSGKTFLAHEFARRAQPWFRDVVWVPAGLRPETQVRRDLTEALDGRRVLVVLDHAAPEFELPPSTCESILVTTRRAPDGLALDRPASRPLRLPDGDSARLWHAMAACQPEQIRLPLAARIAGMPEDQARTVAAKLATSGLVHRFESSGNLYWMPPTARAAAEPESLRQAHAKALADLLSSLPPPDRVAYRAEIAAAVDWAVDNDWTTAPRLVWPALIALRRSWPEEAVALVRALLGAALVRGDQNWIRECQEELSWLESSTSFAPAPGAALPEPQQDSLF